MIIKMENWREANWRERRNSCKGRKLPLPSDAL